MLKITQEERTILIVIKQITSAVVSEDAIQGRKILLTKKEEKIQPRKTQSIKLH